MRILFQCFCKSPCWEKTQGENVLGMSEDGSSFVKKVINAEFYPSFDDPTKRAIVMTDNIIYEERIVKLQGLARGRGYRNCGNLEGDPYLFESHGITLTYEWLMVNRRV